MLAALVNESFALLPIGLTEGYEEDLEDQLADEPNIGPVMANPFEMCPGNFMLGGGQVALVGAFQYQKRFSDRLAEIADLSTHL